MAMNASNAAKALADEYKSIIDPDNGSSYDENTFIDILNKTLDDEFQNGVPSMANVDISTAAGTLAIPLSPGVAQAQAIGLAVATYWSTTIAPSGTPQGICTATPSAIISVVNTAMSIAPLITAGIIALYGKEEATTPLFEDFVKAIIDPISTISWTVTEMGTYAASPPTPCPNVFMVTVS